MKNFRVAIIGRPNVGKSSIFNRMVGRRQAIVHGRAGTTRDAIIEKMHVAGRTFDLSDTAGFLVDKNSVLAGEALKKVKEEIEGADLLLLVVDGTVPPTNEDLRIIDIARKSNKKVFLAINKIDNPNKMGAAPEYQRLGFKDFYFTSAIHNIGVLDLKNDIAKLAVEDEKDQDEEKKQGIRIAIAGRPNVGKSSILNALAKKERAIVSDIPGTTRDVVTERVEGREVSLLISDTAGARKPGKIGRAFKKGEPIERFSFLRTQKEIERADIVLVVIDASDKIAAQDLHIAGDAKELGKGIILVINKWDLVEGVTQEKFLARLQRRFNFMIWVPAIFISAKTGRNVEDIEELVKTVWENQNRKIPTSKLNRILEDYNLENPPAGLKGLKPKTYFASQTGVVPPTYSITAKHHDFVHFSYRRGVENELRRHFDFAGTPIKIEFRSKH
jgi:GTPase